MACVMRHLVKTISDAVFLNMNGSTLKKNNQTLNHAIKLIVGKTQLPILYMKNWRG